MPEAPPQERNPQEEAPAATPFDNPYFLPVLLWLFAGWFFWDAWIEPLEEWLRFNRYGFGFLFGLAVYTTVQAVRPAAFLFAGFMLALAAWLGFLGWLGPADSWYNNDPWAVLFNRYGAGFFVACAAVSALRTQRRLRKLAEAS